MWQNSFYAQLQYFVEIIKYDRNRGYFCIARMIRIVLSFFRFFSVYTYLKDLGEGHRWERRRFWVEITVVLKMLMAVIVGAILVRYNICQLRTVNIVIMFVMGYDLTDTVTYLISLLLMTDIQRPSVNVIRSMLLLVFNYIEVSLEMACLFFYQYKERNMTVLRALEPGLLGNMPSGYGRRTKIGGRLYIVLR